MTDLLDQAFDEADVSLGGELEEYEEVDALDDAVDRALEAQESTEDEPEIEASDSEDSEKQKDLKESTPESEEAEALELIQAPHSWTAEKKPEFEALPRSVQEYIVQRESELESIFQRKSGEAAQLRQRFEPFDAVLQDYSSELSTMGVKEPSQYLRDLIEGDLLIQKDPQTAILRLAEMGGVDLAKLNELRDSGQMSANDPLMSRLDRLERQYSQRERELSRVEQQRQYEFLNQQKAQLDKEINDWAQAKDQSGNLLRPYVEQVKMNMESFVDAVRAEKPNAKPLEIVQEAYDIAVSRHPEIQALVKKENEQKEQQRKIAEAREKASAAKRASSSVSGAPTGNVFRKKSNLSIDEALEEAERSLN